MGDFSYPEPSFFWSRVRRNEGLWLNPIPDVRNFLTSISACVVAINATAHAQMLILREGGGERAIVSFGYRNGAGDENGQSPTRKSQWVERECH